MHPSSNHYANLRKISYLVLFIPSIFYSGITLKALGFPTEMFTVLFALARTVGWIAQWKEMVEDPSQRIGRPRQLYMGATERAFVPMCNR